METLTTGDGVMPAGGPAHDSHELDASFAALAAVTSAMAKTSAQSYQFSLKSTGVLNYRWAPRCFTREG
jgi:hypothetical protein